MNATATADDLTGTVAIVTGASRGFGRAISAALVGAGEVAVVFEAEQDEGCFGDRADAPGAQAEFADFRIRSAVTEL